MQENDFIMRHLARQRYQDFLTRAEKERQDFKVKTHWRTRLAHILIRWAAHIEPNIKYERRAIAREVKI